MSQVSLEDRAHALENEYFRRKELELVEKMKAAIASENSRRTELKCPKCDGTLHETNYENVKIEVCDGCHGVWLDAGELAQVAHHETENKGWLGRFFGK